jgi:RimJ/RimL family protein N-acetyltransferase
LSDPEKTIGDKMIFGERIRFRGVEQADLETFVRWLNDPDVRRGIGLYLPFSSTDEQEWFEKMRQLPPNERVMAIESVEQDPHGQETWHLIGTCGFFNFDSRNASAEFGIMIGEKAYWDRGYGTEAVRLLVKHGFNTLNLNRIHLRVFETNPRATRAYEKAGFTHEGCQRQAEFREGKYIDVLVMSILRSEFLEPGP